MYLVILEDCDVIKTDSYTKEDLEMVDEGTIGLIDISNPDNPIEYYNGEWTKVRSYSGIGVD